MWQILRSVSDTLGVGFLAMQLIKLIGMVFALVGPLKFISSLFEGIFPVLASFFKINFGWSINGLDVMAIAIAMSGTLIVWSSVARHEAMNTRYFFRFLMIPYAFLVIIIAIVVQVTTPIVEINHFNKQCKSGAVEASFYGSACDEMTRQLAFWEDTFGDDPVDEAPISAPVPADLSRSLKTSFPTRPPPRPLSKSLSASALIFFQSRRRNLCQRRPSASQRQRMI